MTIKTKELKASLENYKKTGRPIEVFLVIGQFTGNIVAVYGETFRMEVRWATNTKILAIRRTFCIDAVVGFGDVADDTLKLLFGREVVQLCQEE